LDPALVERVSGRNIRFETRPVEIRQASAECQLAVLNAGHGSAATMLLAGKPMLLIPLFHEQLLLARRVEEMGAGRSAPPDDGKIIARELQKVLGSAAYTTRARVFADRYEDHHKNHRLTDLVDQMEMLIK
jgi:UDP:flavonoid glycosyltransferase YjiC (YdhE family)